jgi:hypothetical protein
MDHLNKEERPRPPTGAARRPSGQSESQASYSLAMLEETPGIIDQVWFRDRDKGLHRLV